MKTQTFSYTTSRCILCPSPRFPRHDSNYKRKTIYCAHIIYSKRRHVSLLRYRQVPIPFEFVFRFPSGKSMSSRVTSTPYIHFIIYIILYIRAASVLRPVVIVYITSISHFYFYFFSTLGCVIVLQQVIIHFNVLLNRSAGKLLFLSRDSSLLGHERFVSPFGPLTLYPRVQLINWQYDPLQHRTRADNQTRGAECSC